MAPGSKGSNAAGLQASLAGTPSPMGELDRSSTKTAPSGYGEDLDLVIEDNGRFRARKPTALAWAN